MEEGWFITGAKRLFGIGSLGAYAHRRSTALLTTEGCRDVLAIGRENRYDLYDLNLELPEPLVPRQRRYEVKPRGLPLHFSLPT